MRRFIPLAVAALAAAGITTAAATATASAATTSHATRGADVILPPHVYAPYFEAYDSTDGGLAQLSAESGAKYVSLAFLQTPTAGSFTADWNGDTSTPISATVAGSFGADIAAIQARGGTVIPSFGGYSADTTGTELADSCTSVSAIASVYESLVTTYHVTRIDLDVEADSLTNTAGIERRNEAVAQTEAWAAAHHKVVQFDYTIPVNPTGLKAGYKVNVIPQEAVAEIDGRYLPGYEDEFLAEIDKLLGPGVRREFIHQDIAVETTLEGDLAAAMTAALYDEDPAGRAVPYCLSGGTDAKSFSRLGIRCFGFAPLRLPAELDFSGMFHGVDERVPVDALRFGVRVLDRFLDLC